MTARPRAIAYDAARGKTVVFAVNTADPLIAETWTWDGSTWSQVTGTQPAAVDAPAMAFDSKRGQVVLFGGCSFDTTTTCPDDTWLFDGTTWTKATAALRPAGRWQHVLAYDPVGDKTVMFGGNNADDTTFQETWSWDGTTWTQAAPTVAPSVRQGAAFVWQPKRERLALIGGWGNGGVGQSDAWEWTGSSWDLIAAPPTIYARGGAIVVPTHDGSALAVTGGYTRAPSYGLLQSVLVDGGLLTWQGKGLRDSCSDAIDFDGDMLAGCADSDCAFTCTPTCPPTEQATCGMQAPRCGDATCASGIEDCRSCPTDCGACTGLCGDTYCDPGETAAACPGDC